MTACLLQGPRTLDLHALHHQILEMPKKIQLNVTQRAQRTDEAHSARCPSFGIYVTLLEKCTKSMNSASATSIRWSADGGKDTVPRSCTFGGRGCHAEELKRLIPKFTQPRCNSSILLNSSV